MASGLALLNRYVVPPLTVLSENTYLSAIRAGMVSVVPLTIIGGLFIIVSFLPVSWGSANLSGEDFRDLPALATKLSQQSNTVSAYLRGALSEESKRALAEHERS